MKPLFKKSIQFFVLSLFLITTLTACTRVDEDLVNSVKKDDAQVTEETTKEDSKDSEADDKKESDDKKEDEKKDEDKKEDDKKEEDKKADSASDDKKSDDTKTSDNAKSASGSSNDTKKSDDTKSSDASGSSGSSAASGGIVVAPLDPGTLTVDPSGNAPADDTKPEAATVDANADNSGTVMLKEPLDNTATLADPVVIDGTVEPTNVNDGNPTIVDNPNEPVNVENPNTLEPEPVAEPIVNY